MGSNRSCCNDIIWSFHGGVIKCVRPTKYWGPVSGEVMKMEHRYDFLWIGKIERKLPLSYYCIYCWYKRLFSYIRQRDVEQGCPTIFRGEPFSDLGHR